MWWQVGRRQPQAKWVGDRVAAFVRIYMRAACSVQWCVRVYARTCMHLLRVQVNTSNAHVTCVIIRRFFFQERVNVARRQVAAALGAAEPRCRRRRWLSRCGCARSTSGVSSVIRVFACVYVSQSCVTFGRCLPACIERNSIARLLQDHRHAELVRHCWRCAGNDVPQMPTPIPSAE